MTPAITRVRQRQETFLNPAPWISLGVSWEIFCEVWLPGRGSQCCCWPGWGKPSDPGHGKLPLSLCGCYSAAGRDESGRECVWKHQWEVPGCHYLEDPVLRWSVKTGGLNMKWNNRGTTVHLLQKCFCVWKRNLINSGGNVCQVLVDAGHSELDLVADTLLWTFSCMCCRDAEEQQAE